MPIGVNKSTVSRKIKRGLHQVGRNASGPIFKYQYDIGQQKAIDARKKLNRPTKLNSDSPEIINLTKIIKELKISLKQALVLSNKHFSQKFSVTHKKSIFLHYTINHLLQW